MKLQGLPAPRRTPARCRLESLGLTGRMLMDLLTPRERRSFYILALVMLLVGILETAGIASILPFMAVLAEPARIEHSHQLAAVYHGLGFTSVNSFLVLLGLVTFLMTMVGIGMHILSIFSISRFTTAVLLHAELPAAAGLPQPALLLVPQPPQRRPRQGGAVGGRQRRRASRSCRR